MVSIVVDWICVHVSDAEDVDQHTKEGSDEEEHHSDVVDVNTYTEDLLVDGHSIFTDPSKRKPISNVMGAGSCTNKFRNEQHRENEARNHDWKSDEAAFFGRLNPGLVSVEDVSKEENDWECKHWQEYDENGILDEC